MEVAGEVDVVVLVASDDGAHACTRKHSCQMDEAIAPQEVTGMGRKDTKTSDTVAGAQSQ